MTPNPITSIHASIGDGALPELRELRYFAAVAEELSFTRAASRCGVGQSALSQSVAQLEARLGVALFDRGERRVRLTPAGEVLLDRAKRAIAAAREAAEAMEPFSGGGAGRLRVGVVQTVNALAVPQVVGELARRFPAARFDVRELPAAGVEELVATGDLDLGVGFHPVARPTLELQPLAREEILLIEWRGRGGPVPVVGAGDLAGRALVLLAPAFCTRRLVDAAFAEHGVRLDPTVETNSVEGALAMVRGNGFATLLPEMALRTHAGAGLSGSRIEGVPISRRLLLLWRRNGYRSPLAAHFAEELKRLLEAQPADSPSSQPPKAARPRRRSDSP
ncbi:MAG: LysR substrate-binding domain-containing protein [Candidatus Sumerlaeia bacterium]|nr:LysR substrate-binding domain-containing protein [Candidatus Sumerlaeia bacterium]